MLQSKKFFRAFWFFTRLFGLQPYELNWMQILFGFILFLSLAGTNFLLLLAKMATTNDKKTVISGIQTMPTFLIMLIDFANLARKSREIRGFFNHLCQVIDESGDPDVFNEAYSKMMKYMKLLGILAFVSINSNTIIFLLTGKTITPIWTPSDHGLGFLCIWMIQTIYINYSVLNLWLLESFMFLSFSLVNAHTLHLRKMIKKMTLKRDDLKHSVEVHMEFKR